MGVGEDREREGGYSYRYTVTNTMTSITMGGGGGGEGGAMGAVLMFINCEGQSHKTVSTDHNLFEEKGERKPNALSLVQSGSRTTSTTSQWV